MRFRTAVREGAATQLLTILSGENKTAQLLLLSIGDL
jgi:hypothetical protein